MTATNSKGRFTNTYVGGTMLLSTNFYPNGQKTIFSYLGVTNDERLSEIWNKNTTNGTISKFDYAYDPVGNITNWTQQTDMTATNVQAFAYDPVNELLSSTVHSNTVAGAVLKQFMYGYDLNGNRTSASVGTGAGISVNSATYNGANQMMTVTNGSGPTQFAGSLNEQGTVAIAGNTATMNHFTTNFVGYASVTNGTNVVPIIATDYSGNSRTNKYQIVITNSVGSQLPLYGADGNMTNDGKGISYEYDAANRTTAINRGTTNRTEFLYNGLGQRVQIIEKTNGVAYTTNKYVWDGLTLCEQRDNSGVTTVKRFFGEGEQISGTNYFFTRDHLGSIREMVNSAGVIQTRYDYDPYGARNRILGSMDADFGFTGHFTIASQPETTLTLYRLYRTDFGIWPNRDPIGELGGLNLYEYVSNDPINRFDPTGELDAVSAYNDWVDTSASGYNSGGIGGYSQWIGAGLGAAIIDFWGARTLQNNSER
jgi:RHS repeat-associated protein